MPDNMITTIDFLRHGEPVGGKKYRGHLDDPLSETGWQQMEQAINSGTNWDAILTSPLKRCAEFACKLSTNRSIPLFEEPRLMEISFGEWEGNTADELIKRDAQQLYAFWSDPFNHPPPGAERLELFLERTLRAWEKLQSDWQGKHLLVICHAGAIRMILCHLLGMPVDRQFTIQVDYASLSRVVIEGDGEQSLARLVSHQGLTHA